jgi:hypothetical protein
VFSILGPVRTRENVDPVAKMTNWELSQSLASELLSPNIQIYLSNETDEAARDFAASTVSAYRLSTRKISKLDQKYEYVA